MGPGNCLALLLQETARNGVAILSFGEKFVARVPNQVVCLSRNRRVNGW